jgi:hypothetical protein
MRLDNVNIAMQPAGMTPTDRYHHGDLPNALRQATVQVIGERGVSGFSLRESRSSCWRVACCAGPLTSPTFAAC